VAGALIPPRRGVLRAVVRLRPPSSSPTDPKRLKSGGIRVVVLDTTDYLVLICAAGVPLLALFGHLWVAYRYAPERAVAGTVRFFTEDPRASEIVDNHVGPAIERWIDSEHGKAFLGMLIEAGGASAEKKIVAAFQGAAGNAARAQDKVVGSTLRQVFFNFQSGDPIIDGAWSLVPVEMKERWFKKVASAIRKAGAHDIAAVVNESDSEPGSHAGGYSR
jgi:hypothetical protein